MRKTIIAILTLLMICQMTGCLSLISTKKDPMEKIKGDIECEFRVGNNAQFKKEVAETDVVIDKDRFVELFNEEAQYDPNHVKYHLDECDLKINAKEQPEEFRKIDDTEVNIKVMYDGTSRSVSVFEYGSKLYFFVLCMGGASKPEEEGYYYMELPKDMASYWLPIIDQVRQDAEEGHLKKYGSFTMEESLSYDRKYIANIKDGGGNILITVMKTSGDKKYAGSFSPCRKSDFQGICWEKDSYNIWVQSGDVGTVCYSLKDGEWVEDPEAVRPEYIVSKYD